jgi:hypothetical protein
MTIKRKMSENSRTEEFLQKLAPCIERDDLEACVEEAAWMAREMGCGGGRSFSHERKSIMIDSVMKYHKPQINADKRRFVVPVLSSFLVLIDANQQNNYFFASFASRHENKINNELGRTKNELTLPEFVSVRFSSLFFSYSFMSHGFIADSVVDCLCNKPLENFHRIFLIIF